MKRVGANFVENVSGAFRRCLTVAVGALVLAANWAEAGEPPFGSTADTVFDIIRSDDPSSFLCLSYEGRAIRQMWDKRLDNEFDLDVFLFRAHYSDGTPIDIILNPEFETEAEARAEAVRYAEGMGRLAPLFRVGIRQFGIHKGDEGFHGGPGKIFMYSGKADLRVSQNKLEESLLHEAVHASLDATLGRSADWKAAQAADGAFVTRYAEEYPDREDLAESALFAWGLLRHPGRIPPVDSADIARQIPARISYFDEIFAAGVRPAAPPSPPDGCT